jgi:hypothetical protein
MGKSKVLTAVSFESLKSSKLHFKCCEISKGKSGQHRVMCPEKSSSACW